MERLRQGGLGAIAMLFALAGTSMHALAQTATQNPLGFFYAAGSNNEPTNVDPYKHPTAMLITGQCNRDAQQFADARAHGAEVLAYLNSDSVIEGDSSNDPCPTYSALYKPDGQPTTSAWLWPLFAPNTQRRVDYQSAGGTNYYMLDLTAGSAWSNRVVDYVVALMQSHTVDGVFLDVIGAKNWSGVTDFESWSIAEQDAWTNGCIDLVRRLDEKRQQINPNFLIVNNGPWVRAGNDQTGIEGEQYVDGVLLEHPNWSTFQTNYSQHAFAPRGHRRMLVVVKTQADVDNWKTVVGGPTHIGLQSTYGSPGAPAVDFHQLFDRTVKFGRTTVATTPSSGLNADYKRASKFTMPKTGWLVDLEAYLSGLGGASGSQQAKIVVYRDNNGAPGPKVAESNARTLASGFTASWKSFSISSRPLLTPGDYWLAIQTGSTGQVLQDFTDGSELNWFANADSFADGASDPFGAATTGNGTLSVYGSYVEQ